MVCLGSGANCHRWTHYNQAADCQSLTHRCQDNRTLIVGHFCGDSGKHAAERSYKFSEPELIDPNGFSAADGRTAAAGRGARRTIGPDRKFGSILVDFIE